jgi:hypothetical protein
MTQAYSDPERESDPHSLPDVEVFEITGNIAETRDGEFVDHDGLPYPPGWYWWTCLPGCLPDSDPVGPFETEEDALADAQDI